MGSGQSKTIVRSDIETAINVKQIVEETTNLINRSNVQSFVIQNAEIIIRGSVVGNVGIDQNSITVFDTKAVIDAVSTTQFKTNMADTLKNQLDQLVNEKTKNIIALFGQTRSDEITKSLKSTINSVTSKITQKQYMNSIIQKSGVNQMGRIIIENSIAKNININQNAQVYLIAQTIIKDVTDTLLNTEIIRDINNALKQDIKTEREVSDVAITGIFGSITIWVIAAVVILILLIGVGIWLYYKFAAGGVAADVTSGYSSNLLKGIKKGVGIN